MAHRKRLVGLLVVAGVAVAAGALAYRYSRPSSSDVSGTPGYAATALRLDGRTFALDIADTPEKQVLGLGKRASLASGQGMVFPYAGAGKRCFWMKDMNFAIDIVWLDGAKRVVHIEPSLDPGTYPKTYCSENTQYVVELPPGTAAGAGLEPGDMLQFQL